VHMGEGAELQSADLSGVVLKRARPLDLPTIIWRALSKRARIGEHRQIQPFRGVSELEVRSLDDRLLPIQVDGDYIGEIDQATFGVMPQGMAVVA